jgi:predicted dehydrogenase
MNPFKAQWIAFLKHIAQDDPFVWDLYAGPKGVQLTEACIESWGKRHWVDLQPI